MGETKSVRLSFSLYPLFRKKIEEIIGPEGEISKYVEDLVMKDLKSRGMISPEDLREVLYD